MKNTAQSNITRSLKTSNSFIITIAAILLLSFPAGAADNILHLSSLDLSKMTSGWGNPVADKSVQSKPLSIAGKTFDKGVGTHAGSVFHIDLHGQAKRFSAEVGIDDETSGKGTAHFRVYADGKKLFDSGTIKGGQAPQHIDLNLKNAKLLTLIVTDAGNNIDHDHANWANAFFEYKGTPPTAIDSPPEPKIILTPKPPLSPRINAPKVYGARPGRPFLYRIPTTGTRPITFTADDMPPTLKLDPATGIITGTTPPKKADYRLALKAVNKYGQTQRGFTIVVGDTLALTPPMGWNHWYTYYNNITDDLMRIAADAMITSGMADFGYQYVNIDDCWMNAPSHRDPLRVGPLRDDEGNILSNKHFPDMRALADYIHAKGLKAGLYTSPGPLTCAGFSGSYQHEQQDAQQFADWGFDFLKYDWCSYGRIAKDRSLPELQKPYRLMGDILKSLDRDIVFNLCQYGMGDVAEWGAEVGGNCWRTAGDLGFSLTNYHNVAIRNAALYENAKPGAWNDPDYLLLGTVGNAHKIWDDPPCPLRLLPTSNTHTCRYGA